MAQLFGSTVAEEFLGKGANLMLGLQLCVYRIPHADRNFERISVEDPYLWRILAGAVVRGVQSRGIMANTDIFIANSQETNRTTQSAELGSPSPPKFISLHSRVLWKQAWAPSRALTTRSTACTVAKTRWPRHARASSSAPESRAVHSASTLAGLDMEMPGEQR